MAECLIKKIEEQSLASDEVLGENLEIESSFCNAVKDCFKECLQFDEDIAFRYVYGKVSITFFFLSEKKLNKSDANKLCHIAEKCLDKWNIVTCS